MYLEKPDDDFLSLNRKNREDRERREASTAGSGSGAKTAVITCVVVLAVLFSFDFFANDGEFEGTSGGKGTQIAAFFDNVTTTVGNIGAALTGSTSNSAGSSSGGYGADSYSGSSAVDVQEVEKSLKHLELKSDLYIIKNTSDISYNTVVCLYYHPQANFVKNNFYNFDSYLVVKNGSAYEFDGCYSMPLDYFASFYWSSSNFGSSSSSNSGSTSNAQSESGGGASESAIDIIRQNLSNENPYKVSVGSVERDFKINASKNNCVVVTAGDNGIDQLYSGSVAKAFENVVVHEATYDEMENVVAQWNATYSLTKDSSK